MNNKELRIVLINFMNEKSIEFDSKISTKNLLIKAKKDGFEYNEEIELEETEPGEPELGETELGETELGETEPEENEPEETEPEEIEINILKRRKKPFSKQSVDVTPSPASQNTQDPKKSDNLWVWGLVTLVISALVFMYFKNRDHGNN